MLCLRINRGLPEHVEDPEWLQSKRLQTLRFFEGDLTQHFEAEESVLFPAMREIPTAVSLIDELIGEHREIEALIRRLQTEDVRGLAQLLKDFALLLEAHIRKEERLLFPIYEQEISPAVAERIEREILSVIGTAIDR